MGRVWIAAGGAALALACSGPVDAPENPAYRIVAEWRPPAVEAKAPFQPMGVTVAADDRVLVSDAGSHRVHVFAGDGRYQGNLGSGELLRPMHMAARNGKVYVADFGHDRIGAFDIESRRLLETVGSRGSGPGEFDGPTGVAVDSEGRVAVADFYNHRVQVFDAKGAFLRQIGETGSKGIRPGRFNYPTDVAFLPDGSLVVADGYNDRIQVFDSEGRFLRKWGGLWGWNVSGGRPGWFRVVASVWLAPDGTLLAADQFNGRVQRFSPEGGFLGAWGRPGEMDRPTDAASDEAGRLYVADFGGARVLVFDRAP